MPENAKKDSELGREDCLAANYRSTGPQQQNTNDDHNCPIDTAERSSSIHNVYNFECCH